MSERTITIEEIKSLFPDDKGYWYPPDYSALIDSFGYTTCISVDDGDYQGDSSYLLRNPSNDELGLLYFGWGSCSGCDALQACDTPSDLAELWNGLHGDIQWFATIDDVRTYLHKDDNINEWNYDTDGMKQFKCAVDAYGGMS